MPSRPSATAPAPDNAVRAYRREGRPTSDETAVRLFGHDLRQFVLQPRVDIDEQAILDQDQEGGK
jgi:hypothetical protein